MRDIEVIDSELGLLLAIRKMAREAEEGRSPNTARIDELSDERAAVFMAPSQATTGAG